jgi:hypothetical protein
MTFETPERPQSFYRNHLHTITGEIKQKDRVGRSLQKEKAEIETGRADIRHAGCSVTGNRPPIKTLTVK